MHCIIITIILLSTTILTTTFATADNNKKTEIMTSGFYEKGTRYNIQGWVYIHIKGEPYERGYQYGYLASAEIVDMINRWSNWGHAEDFMKVFFIKQLPQNYDELSKTFWDLCKQRGMNFFWDQYPEEFQQEIKGIAAGIRARGGTVHGHVVDYKDIFTLNVIEETRETFKNPGGLGRPFKPYINFIKSGIRQILFKGSGKEVYESGQCNAFIATGDATADGGIVMAQSLMFPPNYIPQRANLILDVEPSNGHRFIMTVFPGYIWSSEDYYQNDCGILLAETSLWPPFGPWKVKGTTSIGARARRAIQYSDNIYDVKQSLLDGNNGLYPNDWIMGDTKTGEIASLELSLHNHGWTTTKNGFLWSVNNAKDDKVRWELNSIFGFGIIGRFLKNNFKPNDRDKVFMEMKEKYYGEIDVDIAKKIMSIETLSKLTTDCKVTDSQLVENLGLWVHMGRPCGNHWSPTSEQEEQFKGIQEMPAAGWVKIYGSKSEHTGLQAFNEENTPKKTSKVLWSHETDSNGSMARSSNIFSDGTLFSVSSGSIIALNADLGRQKWESDIGEKIVGTAMSEDVIVTGTNEGVFAINKETGRVEWEQLAGEICSDPVIVGDEVIIGCSDGVISALDVNTGGTSWTFDLSDSAVISDVNNNIVYIGSGKTCCAFDTIDKQLCWEFETDGVITACPRIHGNNVFFGSWDGNVYALDSRTGELSWCFETGWGIDTTPDVSDGLVFVGSNDNNFYALDEKTGELEWFFTCKAGIHSSPVVYGEYVFFGSDDGRFYALDKTNGAIAWSFAPGYTIKDDNADNFITTPILSDPEVIDGVVFISAKDNIYALDAQTVENIPVEDIPRESNNFDSILLLLSAMFIIISVVYIFNKRKKQHKK